MSERAAGVTVQPEAHRLPGAGGPETGLCTLQSSHSCLGGRRRMARFSWDASDSAFENAFSRVTLRYAP